MSNLTALKLQRELEITRRALQERPVLEMEWSVCPQTGRPVASWMAVPPTVMTQPDFT